jgi:inosine-uridine nucleoside N-ribohydrolase
LCSPRETQNTDMKKIPVILDTDIGSDIDDTWALGFLLRCPELDLKLVISATGNTVERSKIIAKFLQLAGYGNIPIGIGIKESSLPTRQARWVHHYDLKQYPGNIFEDGVQALINTIHNSAEIITVLSIGPLPNIAAALQRSPDIAQKARFVGMHGSIYKGYNNNSRPAAEYNVKQNPTACRTTFEAAWDITITPLDTCGLITLDGTLFQRLQNSTDVIVQLILENYRFWWRAGHPWDFRMKQPKSKSSVLFDTVAVALIFTTEFFTMENIRLKINDSGYTIIEKEGKLCHCAVAWKNLEAFQKFLVNRLLCSQN